MDRLLSAVGESLAHAGPEYVSAFGILCVAAWVAAKAMPLYAEHSKARLGIEAAREKRKAEEAERADERERERSRLEGRWLEQYERATEVQERTNAVMGGVQAQMALLNETLKESKDRSRDMARKVNEIHGATMRR